MMFHLAEVFDTIQGEGALVGQRMVFVRFSGCNAWSGLESGRVSGKADCARWCDTDFRPRLSWSLDELLSRMDELWPSVGYAPRWACLTGGEPMLQVNETLLRGFIDRRWRMALETNGSVKADRLYDMVQHITVSPKKGLPLAFLRPDALKVVLPGGWTEAEVDEMLTSMDPPVAYVQPQHGHASGLVECFAAIRRNSRWRLSVQLHKMLGLS